MVIPFNLYASQTFLCKIFWIVNIYDVVIIFFNLRLALSFELFLSLLLKSKKLAFIQTLKVNLLRVIHLGIEIVQNSVFVAF